MPNYQNGKVYRIWSPSTGLQYIGSTCYPLHKRLYEHRRRYKAYVANGNTGRYYTSYEVLKEADHKIELVELCPCNLKIELTATEGKHIRELDCVNKYIAGRDKKEYRQDNKERIKEQSKQYRQDNADRIKQYLEDNKDKIKEQKKRHYQNNKDRLKQKVVCECGVVIRKDCLARHKRSAKHQRLMAE